MQLTRAPTGLSDPKLQVHGSTFHMSQATVWKMTAYTKHRKVAWIERKLKCGRHYTQRGGGGAAARRSVHLCFRRFQRWLTCFKVFFCAVFTLFFVLIKWYLLEPLERPHRLQESNFPSQLHAAAVSFEAFILNFIWKQRTMDFCSLLLIFKDSVTSNHLLPTRVLPMTELVARQLCRESHPWVWRTPRPPSQTAAGPVLWAGRGRGQFNQNLSQVENLWKAHNHNRSLSATTTIINVHVSQLFRPLKDYL